MVWCSPSRLVCVVSNQGSAFGVLMQDPDMRDPSIWEPMLAKPHCWEPPCGLQPGASSTLMKAVLEEVLRPASLAQTLKYRFARRRLRSPARPKNHERENVPRSRDSPCAEALSCFRRICFEQFRYVNVYKHYLSVYIYIYTHIYKNLHGGVYMPDCQIFIYVHVYVYMSEFTELAELRFLDCDSCGMTQGALIRYVADP